MDLETLNKRLEEIDVALTNTNNTLVALNGHKTEVLFWIEDLKKKLDETKVEEVAATEEEVLATVEETPVE